MVSRYKKYWPQALLTILALFTATGYLAYTDNSNPVVSQGDAIEFAGPGVGPADPWTSTSTPSDAITQRIWGRDVKLTGYENLDCIGTDANGMLETGTCGAGGGSGSVGTSTTDVATQVTFFTTNGATPALIAGDSGMTYSSSADRLTVTYASTTGISSGYASSTLAHFGTLTLSNVLNEAYIDSTIARDSELHNAVTLAGEDYLSLATQQITANAIDPDNLSASDFGDFTCNGTTCSLDASYQAADTDLTDLAGLTAATGDLIYGNGTGDWAKRAIGTGGHILSVVSGVPSWVATTTFSGGLTYANGNVTADLGTSIVVGELASADFGDWTCNGSTCTIDANSIALTTDTTGNYVESLTGTTNQIAVTNGSGAEDLDATIALATHVIFGAGGYESAIGSTTNGTSTNYTITGTASTSKLYADGLVECQSNNNLTWAAGTFGCEADDTSAGAANPFTWATNYGVVNAATSSNPIWAQLGVNASSTSHFDNSTTTLATIGTAWITSLFIGADTLAEYIADTAGAFFTGNTETGITATYQDADNTVDLVCNTADTSTFGCLTDTDWDTFNGKQAGDATLTALAAYNTNGLLTQTAADTFAGRTLTGTANQITVTNGDGVAGNPTLTIPAHVIFPGNFQATNSTTTNATTTSLNVLGQVDIDLLTSALIVTGAGGILAEYGGSSNPCTNQVPTTISAVGALGGCTSINGAWWSGQDLAVGDGGTGLSTFGGSNHILYTTAADALASEAAFTYTAGSNLLNVDNITLLSTGELLIPSAANPTISTAREFSIESTAASTSLRYHDGTAERVVNNIYDRSTGPVASSSLAYMGAYGTAGTTSLLYMNAEHPFTVVAMRCKTDANTAFVQISDGTNLGTLIPCTTSGVRTAVASNGSFNMSEDFKINFGSRSATGPNTITVTLTLRDDVD